LISYLTRQRAEVFDLTGRVDDRRYLGRVFPADLPLLLSLQQYPAYKHMVGENWLHWHDYFECFVALSGEGDFSAGTDRFVFAPGDVVVVDPLKIHGVMRMEASHSAFVILFPRHLVAPTETAVDVTFLGSWENRKPGTLPLMRAKNPAAPALHEALLALAQAWFSSEPDRLPELKLRFLNVLLRLRTAFASPEESKSDSDGDRVLRETRLRRALDFVSLHGHEAISQPLSGLLQRDHGLGVCPLLARATSGARGEAAARIFRVHRHHCPPHRIRRSEPSTAMVQGEVWRAT
jgi:hypothetical protein